MNDSERPSKFDKKRWGKAGYKAGSGGIYFFGLIGSAVYFIQHATSFSDGVVGVISAIFWPAVLIHKVFELLKI